MVYVLSKSTIILTDTGGNEIKNPSPKTIRKILESPVCISGDCPLRGKKKRCKPCYALVYHEKSVSWIVRDGEYVAFGKEQGVIEGNIDDMDEIIKLFWKYVRTKS